MSDLAPSQRRRLEDMGREPISLPAEIYFAGNVQKQKNAGTDKHPNILKHNLRVAEDRLSRAMNDKMSDSERMLSSGGLEGKDLINKLRTVVAFHKNELAVSLGLIVASKVKEMKPKNVENKPSPKAKSKKEEEVIEEVIILDEEEEAFNGQVDIEDLVEPKEDKGVGFTKVK